MIYTFGRTRVARDKSADSDTKAVINSMKRTPTTEGALQRQLNSEGHQTGFTVL
jgi:hypothetical protein